MYTQILFIGGGGIWWMYILFLFLLLILKLLRFVFLSYSSFIDTLIRFHDLRCINFARLPICGRPCPPPPAHMTLQQEHMLLYIYLLLANGNGAETESKL